MRHLLPARAERIALRIAHRLRHHWRRWRKPQLRGVSVAVYDGADRLLLVRHAYGPAGWSLPGGGIGRAESPLDAAIREMDEELRLPLAEVSLAATFEHVISNSPHTTYLVRARAEAAPQPDRREIVEARFFALDDLPHDVTPVAEWFIARIPAR